MIIGNGDIASVLRQKDKEDLLFFASGVSNSQTLDESEYEREWELLNKQDRSKHIIYFGSLAIFYSDTRYAQHKKEMESFIKESFPKYTIIRLGNITWGDNPATIINFFKNSLKNGNAIEVKDEYRYLCDLNEFLHWVSMIPQWNCEMNITGRMIKVQQILDEVKEGKL